MKKLLLFLVVMFSFCYSFYSKADKDGTWNRVHGQKICTSGCELYSEPCECTAEGVMW